jgi:DNA-3-methyladenine glycosylase
MASDDSFGFLAGDSVEAASRLLGCLLIRELDDRLLVGRIVETEAYHQSDAASHSYKGSTPRTEVMFGPPGHAYVYFTYGMHYCMNVVTGPAGEGSAVLIRALEPLEGQDKMRQMRGTPDSQLTNGPAKLCKALSIERQWNGHDLHELPLRIQIEKSLLPEEIVQTTRIGITRDTHRPWRFYIRGNPFISKP